MTGPSYYIGDVLNSLCNEHFADICKAQKDKRGKKIATTFPGNRPSAVGDGMTEFLVIKQSKAQGEHGAYQIASIYIQIFVKNLQNGIQDTKRMVALTKAVLDKFKDGPICSADGRWKVSRPVVQFSGDDTLGFNGQLIRCTLFINTTDRFGGEVKA